MSLAPAHIGTVLAADRERLEQIIDEAGRLVLQAALLAVAARHHGRLEVTTARLERLTRTLHEAVEDARAAARAWRSGR
jgi:hypothetical protein